MPASESSGGIQLSYTAHLNHKNNQHIPQPPQADRSNENRFGCASRLSHHVDESANGTVLRWLNDLVLESQPEGIPPQLTSDEIVLLQPSYVASDGLSSQLKPQLPSHTNELKAKQNWDKVAYLWSSEDEPQLPKEVKPLPGLGNTVFLPPSHQNGHRLNSANALHEADPPQTPSSKFRASFEQQEREYWMYKIREEGIQPHLPNVPATPQNPSKSTSDSNVVFTPPSDPQCGSSEPCIFSARITNLQERMKSKEWYIGLMANAEDSRWNPTWADYQRDWQNHIAAQASERGLGNEATAKAIKDECAQYLAKDWVRARKDEYKDSVKWIRKLREQCIQLGLSDDEQECAYEHERESRSYDKWSEDDQDDADTRWSASHPSAKERKACKHFFNLGSRWAQREIAQGAYYQPTDFETDLTANQQRLEAAKEVERHNAGVAMWASWTAVDRWEAL